MRTIPRKAYGVALVGILIAAAVYFVAAGHESEVWGFVLALITALATGVLAWATINLWGSTQAMAKASEVAANVYVNQTKALEGVSIAIQRALSVYQAEQEEKLMNGRRQIIWELDENKDRYEKWNHSQNPSVRFNYQAWNTFRGLPLFPDAWTDFLRFLYEEVLPRIENSAMPAATDIIFEGNPHGWGTVQIAATNLFGGLLLSQLHEKYGVSDHRRLFKQ